MRSGRRWAIVVMVIAGVLGLTGQPALAAYYNTYTDIASTPDTNGCTGAQGFATASNSSSVGTTCVAQASGAWPDGRVRHRSRR